MKLIDNTGLSYLISKIKTMIGLKADKTYVDNKVKTDVPAGAVFTDTVYTHPASHPASMITGLPTSLPADGGNADTVGGFTVGVNVPTNAKFTDTVYSHPSSHPASMITESSTKRFVSDSEKSTWNSKSDTDTVTTINGKTGAIAKADIVALGIPSQDTNTTYTEITTAEIDAGTASTLRTITGRRVKYILDKAVSSVSDFAPISHTHSASDINSGTLSYLRIPRGTTSTTVATGNHTHSDYASSSHTHSYLPLSGGVLENYREKLTTVSATGGSINLSLGNVFQHTPSGNRTYSISNAVSGQAHSFTLIINMGSTLRTLTFPSSIKWQGGKIPDMSTRNKTYVLTFVTVNGGTTWLGMFGGEF